MTRKSDLREIYGLSPRFSGAKGGHFGRLWSKINFNPCTHIFTPMRVEELKEHHIRNQRLKKLLGTTFHRNPPSDTTINILDVVLIYLQGECTPSGKRISAGIGESISGT